MFSKTELFPLDCDPTTAICGKSIGFWTCNYREPHQSGNLRALKSFLGSQHRSTYSDCGEDILQLVDKADEAWVVDINPIGFINYSK